MVDGEKEKIYERDVNNYINYINENNEDYKKHNLELVRKSDLKKQKVKTILKSVISSIIILVGLLVLAGVIFYGSYYDSFKSEFICNCNETLICEGDVLSCDCEKCPACSVVCGDFPSDLDINLNIVNGSG